MLVTTEWLAEHLRDPDVRVVDMRGYVVTRPVGPGVDEADYRGARDEYLAAHIPGAVYVDWTRDIIDPDDPVPVQIAPPERFAEAMAVRGIGDGTHVIAVDHAGGQYATRLWWALGYYGHDRVSVLDGGWNRWLDEGRPTEAGEVSVPRATFMPRPRPDRRLNAEQIAGGLGGAATRLADRRRPRYGAVHRGPATRAARRPHSRARSTCRASCSSRRRAASCRSTRSGGGSRIAGCGRTAAPWRIATAGWRRPSSCSTWRGWDHRRGQLRRLLERVGSSARPAGRDRRGRDAGT